MELNWSTFLLEIVNFLVLVWILKRFFYKPVQAVIERRRKAIEERLAKAEQMQQQARELQQQYEGRLDHWRNERQRAREALDQELKAERVQREQALQETLEQQRQKVFAVEQRHQQDLQRQLELQALQQGSEFAARLLAQAAGPDVEARLGELLAESIEQLSEEQLAQLREQLPEGDVAPNVASAFPLDAGQRERIAELLDEILGRKVQCHFVEDPELLAGLSIALGPWELAANLRDELRGFAQIAREPVGD